jgi:hypothetical protein
MASTSTRIVESEFEQVRAVRDAKAEGARENLELRE